MHNVAVWSYNNRAPVLDVQPLAIGLSFLESQTQASLQFSTSFLPRFVEKKPIRLRLEVSIERHSKYNRLYIACEYDVHVHYDIHIHIHNISSKRALCSHKNRIFQIIKGLYCGLGSVAAYQESRKRKPDCHCALATKHL